MEDWEGFCASLRSESLIAEIVRRSGEPEERVRAIVTAHLAEGAIGLDVARRGLVPGQRILEVGAGFGIVSLYLKQAGYDICALEPYAEGFELFRIATEEIASRTGVTLPRIERGVQDLDPAQDGSFDFIFSVNVLEHVPDFHEAIDAMTRVLKPGGLMIHSCPNYWIPYEPHLSIPLLPFLPAATATLLPSSLRNSAVWRSLNFVTYGDAKRAAKRNRLAISFVPGLLSGVFRRLAYDPVFSERHGRAVRWAGAGLRRSGLLRMMDALPPWLSTPMIAIMRNPHG